MKRNVLFAVFAASLAFFSASRPGLANSDLPGNLQKEGWTLVAPGVLQRGLENNKVETLGFGAEGLQFKLDEMRTHYAFLRAEFERQPTKNLQRTIRAHRAEILRTAAALENAKATGEKGLISDKTAAGFDCSIQYGASVNAFPLTGGSPGVGATASAYFNSNCGQSGSVYASSYSQGTGSDNVFRTASQSDPSSQTPRTGSNVTASASTTVVAVSNCYSYAYASLTSSALNVSYSQTVTNYTCPNPPVPVPSVDYSYIQLYGYNCQTVTWSASASGGTSPYSYAWYRYGSYVGSGSSYSEMFCGSNYNSSYSETATVTVTDSSSQSGSASASTWIYTYPQNNNCPWWVECPIEP